MSDRTDLPAPVDAIVRALGGASPEADERASTFARGLALGALVGAAIAGSAIWQRRQARRVQPGADSPGTAAFGDPAASHERGSGMQRG
jgi:hypothetical protein